MKIMYFNTGFISIWYKIQANIKKNSVKKYIEKS